MLFGKAARKAVKSDAIQASECRKLINITKIPTMTVPFDTDVLLFLVSATSPSGHTQPMEVHAYVFVEQWPLWNPVSWATVPPRSSCQGKEGPQRGLACRQGRQYYFGPARGSGNRADFSFITIVPSTPRMVPPATLLPVRPHAACCCATCTGLLFLERKKIE